MTWSGGGGVDADSWLFVITRWSCDVSISIADYFFPPNDGWISIADFFPPNRGFDLLILNSSRQIGGSI
jgi:hypothetical protein